MSEKHRRPILNVTDLDVAYRGQWTPKGRKVVHAVQDVSFSIANGETVGLVGESGSGKSTVAHALFGIVGADRGEVILNGVDILSLPSRKRRRALGQMQMVFQDPYSSLDPRMTVAQVVAEPLRTHEDMSHEERSERVAELLAVVGLRNDYAGRYPHEFSGGQRQRIAIARAMSTNPELLILDEAVSALDASITGQIVNLLLDLREEFATSFLFISHDMTLVSHIADRTLVMYAGKIVETGPTTRVFDAPAHPYTQALLSAIPVPDPPRERARRRIILQGDPPQRSQPWTGCPFASRCPEVMPACHNTSPPFVEISGGGRSACLLHIQNHDHMSNAIDQALTPEPDLRQGGR